MAKCPAWREGNQGFEPFSYDRCYATKEMETCECLGNEAFCDFYPEKRKAATEPKYGEWISVKDRLPESTDLYLINAVHRYNKTDGYRSAQVRLFFKDDDEWHGLPDLYEVTHWMPLPEPPKEE